MEKRIIVIVAVILLLVLPLALGPRGNYSYEQSGGPEPSFSYLGQNISAEASFKVSGFSFYVFAYGNNSSTLRIVRLNDLSEVDLDLGFRVLQLSVAGDQLIVLGEDRVASIEPLNPSNRSEISASNALIGEDYLVTYNVVVRDLGNAIQYDVGLRAYCFDLKPLFSRNVTVNASYPGGFRLGILEANRTTFLALSYPGYTQRTEVYAISETATELIAAMENLQLTKTMEVLDSAPFFVLENSTGGSFLYSPYYGLFPLPYMPEELLSLVDGSGIFDFDGDGSPEVLLIGNSTVVRVDLSSGVDLVLNLSGEAVLVPLDYDWDGNPDILEFNESMVSSISTNTGLHLWRYDTPQGYRLDVGQFRLWRLRGLDLDFDGDGFPDIIVHDCTVLGDRAIVNLTLVGGAPPFGTLRTFSFVEEFPTEVSLVEFGVRALATDLVGGDRNDFLAYAKFTGLGKSWFYLYAVFSADRSSPPMKVRISWSGGDLGVHGGPILASEWGTWYSLGLRLGTGISRYGFTVPWIGELPW